MKNTLKMAPPEETTKEGEKGDENETADAPDAPSGIEGEDAAMEGVEDTPRSDGNPVSADEDREDIPTDYFF